jgi:kynurenine formamidase
LDQPDAAAVSTTPTTAQVLAYFETLSNWGRWGADDRRGTLNYVTPDVTRAAAGEIRDGQSVSCAWDIDSTNDLYGPPQRYMINHGQGLGDEHRVLPRHRRPSDRSSGAAEYVGFAFHGMNMTHIDALSHIFWDRKMYNGVPAEHVTSHAGAVTLPITDIGGGVTSRGVLLDIPPLLGVDWLEPGFGVTPEHLEGAERRQGVRVRSGDIVFLRVGYSKRRREQGPRPINLGQAGWHASSLPWLHEREVAVIGNDGGQDAMPSGYHTEGLPMPIHAIGITAMGLWLIDNLDLEPLAEACAERGRWTFFVHLAPLRLAGATGSPLNPIAIF